ncbi:type VII secretion protein EssC [Olsenella sp. HMSC062G07]|uniref:type VII secretion protein EssC n=1 Tax=Olsenella sp. HMSC062G07 TaxID=1739330 RepID=UPI0008A20F62|nr:type VII secretion protein EssC [Olsenella sp. HMSC062G07]OFK22487.1 hypothetical protein HMPREF2826_01710 [Olsenella sp. HMSC062G07]
MADLLLTLVSQGVSHTFSLDPSAQSTADIGLGSPLLRVEVQGDGAVLSPAFGYQVVTAQGEALPRATVPLGAETALGVRSLADDALASLYCRPATAGVRRFGKLGFSFDASVLIGRCREAQLHYESGFVSERHARLDLKGESFTLTDLGSGNGSFVNDRRVAPHQAVALVPGDVVRILDLTVMVGRRLIVLNDPEGLVVGEIPGATAIDHRLFREACPPASKTLGTLPLFFPAPRLLHSVHGQLFQVDEPPHRKVPDDTPAILQMGPSFVMGMASLFSASYAIQNIAQGGSLMSGLPSIAMCTAMLLGMVIWPIASRAYTKRRDEADERRREARYTDYLNAMGARFERACDDQAEILRLRRTDVGELIARTEELSPRLMNRGVDHEDFMALRVGVGNELLDADVRWPQRRFSMEEDKLLDKVAELEDNPPVVHDVPLCFNPRDHFCAGVVGARWDVWAFARGLIVQVASLYSYQDVKVVLVADPDEEGEWGFVRAIPHLFDDTGARRLIACDPDRLIDVFAPLERMLEIRLGQSASEAREGPHFLVLCASKALSERSDTVGKLERLRSNLGFSLVFFGEALRDLPRECSYVIDLTDGGVLSEMGATAHLPGTGRVAAGYEGSARMFDRDDVAGTMVRFDADILVSPEEARHFALGIARVRLDLPSQRVAMPKSLGFLEMFEVGSVGQLNLGQRWAENDASRTLQTPVGKDAAGELAMLNLHERSHGPHGLVAGTTGSGKSEFIITYILSLCANYAPDQVAFVLIDYKGGGLAGAFDNERYRLPHLAGTITNLDGAAISRSLVSIKSELKRRQDAFNAARDVTGEATMDIYKYLRYYRQGLLTDPLPHLFIVADEFAELKQQEPEFMDELISAARIGRSLGVHLILATQKPSGVVNDQIWSNSRFKVCLKVADAADSKEMIRRPDAAEIDRPGRYCMLVGYNEYFCEGQAAYAGAPYAPTEVFEPHRDDAVELIDDIGDVVASLRPPSKGRKASETSELNAVLEGLGQAARLMGRQAKPLWLPPLATHIALDELMGRYPDLPRSTCCALVGEVDDPGRQRQFPYVVDLAACGNLLVFGAQDSGADGLVATLLLSLALGYAPHEVSFYALDLGPGVLTPLATAPQCGGVVVSGDYARTESLLRLVRRECVRRRALLARAGCTFEDYNARSEERLGHVVVALTNIAAFYDLFAEFEDLLITLTRDAPRLGVHFVVSASSANAARMRLRANFSTSIVCALNDEGDVTTILGKKPQAVVARQDKRGYVVVGKEIFEFKGASAAAFGEVEADAIASTLRRRSQDFSERAEMIPVLPAAVHPQDMDLSRLGEGILPVGFDKREMRGVGFSFARCPSLVLLGNDQEGICRYLLGLRACLAASGEVSYLFVDSESYLGQLDDPCVAQGADDARARLLGVLSGYEPVGVLVFTSVIETMASLPAEVADPFKAYLIKSHGKSGMGIVAATEAWRSKSVYDEWYKALTAYGNGIWVGSGFSDQSTFHYPRLLPEYREPTAQDDGFLAVRGEVTAVRLVSAAAERGRDAQ